MSRKRLLAGAVALGLGAWPFAAVAQPAPSPIPLPSPGYPLPAQQSDVIAIGDAATRIQLAVDAVPEPNVAPGIERPLQIQIPVTLAGGLQAPLSLTQTVFVHKGVAPTDLAYVSDIIDGIIDLDPNGLCCELTIEMFTDSDFVKGVPIALAGGIDPNANFLFETGSFQDITAALDLDVQCPVAGGGMTPCVKDLAGNGLLVLAASDLEVPEPGVWMLLVAGCGLAGAGLRRARRERAVEGAP